MELAAYYPRGSFGLGLSYAVANRGACHLSTTAFALEVYFNLIDPYGCNSKASLIKFQEDINCAINSLQTCAFTAFPYELETLLMKLMPTFMLRLCMNYMAGIALRLVDVSMWPEFWSSITGYRLGITAFLRAGARVHVLERLMNTEEGISRKDDTLPSRLLNEQRKCDDKGLAIPLEKMLNRYYFIRGFDKNGIPRKRTINKLKISKAAGV